VRTANINNNQSLQLGKKIPSTSVIIHTRNTEKLPAFLCRDLCHIGLPAALAARADHGFYGLPAL
jgi:hypothetical protein